MAREQTVVALSEEAKKKITARMAERGETAATYFSNPAGGRSASTAAFATPPDARTVTAGDTAGYMKTGPGISAVSPDRMAQYRQALVRTGLNQGMQDADLTMALYTSPEERRAARQADADRVWAAEKKSVIGRLDAKVKTATDSAGFIAGRPLADTAKWGRTVQKANTDFADMQSAAIDKSLSSTLLAARSVQSKPPFAVGRRVTAPDNASGAAFDYDAAPSQESVYRRMPEASLTGVNTDPTHPMNRTLAGEAEDPRSRVNILLAEQALQERATIARDRSNQMTIELLRRGGTLKPGKRPRKTSDREPSVFKSLEGMTLRGRK